MASKVVQSDASSMASRSLQFESNASLSEAQLALIASLNAAFEPALGICDSKVNDESSNWMSLPVTESGAGEDEATAVYSQFLQRLREYSAQLTELTNDYDKVFGQLDSLHEQFVSVNRSTAEVREACQRLMQHKERLLAAASRFCFSLFSLSSCDSDHCFCNFRLKERLSYFEEASVISSQLNRPAFAVINEDFGTLLDRIDTCAHFLKEHVCLLSLVLDWIDLYRLSLRLFDSLLFRPKQSLHFKFNSIQLQSNPIHNPIRIASDRRQRCAQVFAHVSAAA